MTITLYVHEPDKYGKIEIDTEKEHQERISKEYSQSFLDNSYLDRFVDFLDSRYGSYELFVMEEEERKECVEIFKENFFFTYDEEFGWEKIEKEIEG